MLLSYEEPSAPSCEALHCSCHGRQRSRNDSETRADVIAPDVRELKARLESLEHRVDDRFKSLEQRMDDRFKAVEQRIDDRFASVDQRFVALEQRMDAKFDKVLAAIASMKNESELTAVREVSAPA